MCSKVVKPYLIYQDGRSCYAQVYELPLQKNSIWNDPSFFSQDEISSIKKSLLQKATMNFFLTEYILDKIIDMIMYHIPLNTDGQLPMPEGVNCAPTVYVEDEKERKYYLHQGEAYKAWWWCSRALDSQIKERENKLFMKKQDKEIQENYEAIKSNTLFLTAYKSQNIYKSPFNFFRVECYFSEKKPDKIVAEILNGTLSF